MAKARAGLVVSHWHKLFENFQASSLDFYAAVEAAAKRRLIPEASISRVDWREGGLASARREYLRVSRGRLSFDICAAPFGTGFFFSWWLAEAQNWWALLFLLVPLIGIPLGLLIAWGILAKIFGALIGSLLTLLGAGIGVPLMLWLFLSFMNRLFPGWDDPLTMIPIFGPIYERLFRPLTYYRIDTTLMFQEAVSAAVLEVIDGLTTAKGVRALTELERKPIMRGFIR